jgi:hypothetical protein
MAEPIELRAEYARLQAKRHAVARDITATYCALGEAEKRARWLIEQITISNAEIARLEALDCHTSEASLRAAENRQWEQRHRDNYAQQLDLISIPRTAVEVSDVTKET